MRFLGLPFFQDFQMGRFGSLWKRGRGAEKLKTMGVFSFLFKSIKKAIILTTMDNDNERMNFPPNETDETCPICLEAYDREIGRLKDGIRNSGYESNCPHWCCCCCWANMSKQHQDEYCCPICRNDITDWLKAHYPEEEEEDEENQYDIETTLVSGIICNKCQTVLPTMTMAEHLDINNPLNICRTCESVEPVGDG